jgi:hypothetical protein
MLNVIWRKNKNIFFPANCSVPENHLPRYFSMVKCFDHEKMAMLTQGWLMQIQLFSSNCRQSHSSIRFRSLNKLTHGSSALDSEPLVEWISPVCPLQMGSMTLHPAHWRWAQWPYTQPTISWCRVGVGLSQSKPLSVGPTGSRVSDWLSQLSKVESKTDGEFLGTEYNSSLSPTDWSNLSTFLLAVPSVCCVKWRWTGGTHREPITAPFAMAPIVRTICMPWRWIRLVCPKSTQFPTWWISTYQIAATRTRYVLMLHP